MSSAPPRATVEDFEDPDDPYAPYQPRRSGRSGSRGARSSTAASSSSTSQTSSRSTASSSSTHAYPNDARSAGSSRTSDMRSSYGQNSTASDIYERSASSGTQGSFPREGGDEEPLFGGRPFRDAHDPSAAAEATSGDPSRATDKEYLYALLNVPSDASAEAIKDAYRALAVVLHPDKHNDPARKSAAESRFREVQRAYEILSDPEKRTVYDYFGEEGLKSSWSVAVRGRSPHEMQAEFERERRRKQAADAEALVKSKGDFTAHIDATALFAPASRIPRRQPSQPRVPAVGKDAQPGVAPDTSADAGIAAMQGLGVAGFPRTVTMAERISRVGCTQLIGKHGFETQVTNRTSATFSGQMVSRNGLGGGNLVGTLKTHWSPRLFTEITLSFLRPQIITTKGQFTLDANSFFSWQSTMQTLLMPPTFNLTYGQRLSSKSTLTGFTTVRSGTYSLLGWGAEVPGQTLVRREPAAVSVGLTKQIGEGRGWTTQTSISPVDQNISVDYALPVLGGVKLRSGFNIGTGSGLSAFTSAERRLTENVRLALGLNCALPVGGVTLRIKVNRLGQKIALPILLAREFRSDLVVLFTVVPAAAYTALHWGVLEPRKQRRLRNRLGELRAANSDLILERRQAALDALALLRDQASKKARSELARSGLVIISAVYGRRDAFPPALDAGADAAQAASQVWSEPPALPVDNEQADVQNEAYWDATIAVQALVNHSQLIVPAARSKSYLLGFHDPVMGEKKHLRVTYAFRGQLHQVQVQDLAELAMPMRIHQLS
ncbi:DnaJ-domain-containing protein [Moesziomyces antarcticus]|uniref:DnaJ-domain-containing protein n=2 Tax=Pseudozyma antarctica TaxID=84753 RepID=A0A081CGL0_PSEA2|nr:DnaJ-domain-containing protein [Moesziomyces antarcticus]GAK65806.1 DnaJ-domain-containing protein [Moesziomyces antarcticus]SPO45433.1 uncharacterized protein PSANT_03119 [Moesziomyces antarcticus]